HDQVHRREPAHGKPVLPSVETVSRDQKVSTPNTMKNQIRQLILAALLLIAAPLRAQLVNDGATNTLSNVTNSFSSNVTIGTNGLFTLLVLSNNTLLSGSADVIIGRNATAKSNEVRLISPSARWLMGGLFAFPTVHVGSNG